MSEGEPQWLEEDSNAVLAFMEIEDNTCSGCSLPFEETLNPDNERKYSSTPVICHACAARKLAADSFHESADDYQKAGALFPVSRQDD